METSVTHTLNNRQVAVFKALLAEKIQVLTAELTILNELLDVQKSLNTPVPAPTPAE